MGEKYLPGKWGNPVSSSAGVAAGTGKGSRMEPLTPITQFRQMSLKTLIVVGSKFLMIFSLGNRGGGFPA
jgi:hypothetical protein